MRILSIQIGAIHIASLSVGVLLALTLLTYKLYVTGGEKRAAFQTIYAIDSLSASGGTDDEKLENRVRTLLGNAHGATITGKDKAVADELDTYFEYAQDAQRAFSRANGDDIRLAQSAGASEATLTQFRSDAVSEQHLAPELLKTADDTRSHLMKELK